MIKKTLLIFTSILLLSTATVAPTYGFDPYAGAGCNGTTNGSAVCTDKTTNNPISGPNGLLRKITKIIAFIAGAAAVILIIVGALRYITAGDANAASQARGTIVSALIGLAIIVLSASIITFVLDKIKL